jgi:hypothetical protein
LLKGIELGIALLILIAVVILAHAVVGLSSLVAIFVGIVVTRVASAGIRRRFLPEVPTWTDEERIQLSKVRPVWLPLGIMAVALLVLVARIPLGISLLIVALSVGVLIASEIRAQQGAERRLER